MEETEQSNLGEGIVYHAFIPFEWHPLDSLSESERLARQEARLEANEHRMRTIAILNEYPVDMSEEFHHLEFKMNLLLEMMGEVMASQMSLPPKCLLNLTASAVEWEDDRSVLPDDAQDILVDLYLHPQYPKPVSLRGRVVSLKDSSDRCLCVVSFDSLPDTLNDQIEKFIFTHHRREVALSRRTSS